MGPAKACGSGTVDQPDDSILCQSSSPEEMAVGRSFDHDLIAP